MADQREREVRERESALEVEERKSSLAAKWLHAATRRSASVVTPKKIRKNAWKEYITK